MIAIICAGTDSFFRAASDSREAGRTRLHLGMTLWPQ